MHAIPTYQKAMHAIPTKKPCMLFLPVVLLFPQIDKDPILEPRGEGGRVALGGEAAQFHLTAGEHPARVGRLKEVPPQICGGGTGGIVI